MNFPSGTVLNGGYIFSSDYTPTTAGDGCIFTGVTFENPTQFGKGCVFINCTFKDKNDSIHSRPHQMGEGNIFSGCSFDYTVFGSGNIANSRPSIGWRFNTIHPNMKFTPTSESHSAVQASSLCPRCGHITVVSNGDKLEDGYLMEKEEHKNETPVSTGVCSNCGT